jgi:hypothetical protein
MIKPGDFVTHRGRGHYWWGLVAAIDDGMVYYSATWFKSRTSSVGRIQTKRILGDYAGYDNLKAVEPHPDPESCAKQLMIFVATGELT